MRKCPVNRKQALESSDGVELSPAFYFEDPLLEVNSLLWQRLNVPPQTPSLCLANKNLEVEGCFQLEGRGNNDEKTHYRQIFLPKPGCKSWGFAGDSVPNLLGADFQSVNQGLIIRGGGEEVVPRKV